MLAIKNNLVAVNAARHLGMSYDAQAGISMLAQANAMPQMALSLLR